MQIHYKFSVFNTLKASNYKQKVKREVTAHKMYAFSNIKVVSFLLTYNDYEFVKVVDCRAHNEHNPFFSNLFNTGNHLISQATKKV